MIKETIKNEMVVAMKAQDKPRLTTIRMILAKIKDKEIELRGEASAELNNSMVLTLMQQMIKQRMDSITEYTKANRLDLAQKEEDEIVVIKSFMPAPLAQQEVNEAIKEAIAEIKAAGVKDTGKVVNYLKEKYAGRLDMGAVSAKIKELLS
ncbi:MAG: GatB/YqeY domain-containing protein [Alphaproteobacteria bacterium]|nr:GatB/YqeY domain-containing protein [Alphaproteobacteria bacterium]